MTKLVWFECHNQVCAPGTSALVLPEYSTAIESNSGFGCVEFGAVLVLECLEASPSRGLCPHLPIRGWPALLKACAHCWWASLGACQRFTNQLSILPWSQSCAQHPCQAHQEMPVPRPHCTQSQGGHSRVNTAATSASPLSVPYRQPSTFHVSQRPLWKQLLQILSLTSGMSSGAQRRAGFRAERCRAKSLHMPSSPAHSLCSWNIHTPQRNPHQAPLESNNLSSSSYMVRHGSSALLLKSGSSYINFFWLEKNLCDGNTLETIEKYTKKI